MTTSTVIIRERVTRRQWDRDRLGVMRRLASRLGLLELELEYFRLEVQLVAPLHKHRSEAIFAARVTTF